MHSAESQSILWFVSNNKLKTISYSKPEHSGLSKKAKNFQAFLAFPGFSGSKEAG